jgi:hypothetical protein
MENFALTMRETADHYNEEREKAKKVRHEKYVEETVIPALETVARMGGYQTNIAVDSRMDWVLTKKLLEELGFTVGHLSKYRTLCVAW